MDFFFFKNLSRKSRWTPCFSLECEKKTVLKILNICKNSVFIFFQAQSTTKIPRLTNKDSSDSKKGDLAPTDPDPDVQYKNFLIKDLKAEDFEMETPVAAYFTLIVGSTVCFLCLFYFLLSNQKSEKTRSETKPCFWCWRCRRLSCQWIVLINWTQK